jgi:hypothetical protein
MAPADGGGEQPHKAHRQHKSGAKARKKKGKGKGDGGDDAGSQQKNPKVRCRFDQARDWCPWSDLLGRHGSGSFVLIRRPCHSFRLLHFSQQRRRSVYKLGQLRLNNGVSMSQLWTVPSANLLLLLL